MHARPLRGLATRRKAVPPLQSKAWKSESADVSVSFHAGPVCKGPCSQVSGQPHTSSTNIGLAPCHLKNSPSFATSFLSFSSCFVDALSCTAFLVAEADSSACLACSRGQQHTRNRQHQQAASRSPCMLHHRLGHNHQNKPLARGAVPTAAGLSVESQPRMIE